jgi:serine/threonine-protein kinase
VRSFGRYRLLEPLASGGMADVFRAEHAAAEGVTKEVALKLVRGEYAARSDFVQMFIQEARLAARLTHANLVQVFDFDQVDGRYYIAMELVRGRHLGQVVERCRELGVRLGLARAVHVGAEVAKGLAYAHRVAGADGRPLGLVHRDVSPHNVLVSFEGEVKLADFGIARAMNLGGLTEPGTLKGKIAYMAPEQARSAPVDARADVFSLGVVLWELCAGRRLFARESDAAALAAVLGDEPPSPPSAWNEAVPPELDAAILGALARDPGARTASAQALATQLAAILLRLARGPEDLDLRALMQQLWPEAAGPGPSPAEETRVAAARAEAPQPAETDPTRTAVAPRRRRWPALVGAIALAAVAAGAGAVAWQGRGPRSAAGAPGAAQAPAAPSATAPAAAPAGAPGTAPAPAPGAPPTGEPAAAPVDAAVPALASAGSTPSPRPPVAEPARAEPGSAGSAAPGGGPVASDTAHRLFGLPLPPIASGEGLLSVNVTPWASLSVNGVAVGETPREVRLPAGRYRVRVEHPHRGRAEAIVVVESGRRTRWLPALRR